tara:strand:+ start:102 stop:491 length:390 start_codon:yes stop_codon:yes gene_type:complete
LITANQKGPYRWVLLRHTGAPDDLRGIHFDLLLEDKEFCRTWRLSDIPLLDGPYVSSVYIAPHKLDWLEITEKVVSGNRGVATRIKKGVFLQSLPRIERSFINLSLQWEDDEGQLLIDENGCRIFRKKH